MQQHLRAQLNNLYEQQAQIKYLFYNVAPIPISQAPRLALVLEREQKRKEQPSSQDESSLDENDKTKLIQDQRINSFEDLYGTKKPIALSKLFEKQDPEDIASNKILILGRAGIGKTTLCQFVAYEWSQGRLWNERYGSVFWIPLRNLNKKYYRDKQDKREQITLAEVIFQECCQTKGAKSAVILADIQRLLENNQTKNNILLLGDGWDEIAQLNQEGTPVGDLLNELLAWEHVILTSRPYAILDTVQGYKRLENIGFLNEDIEDYVNKFFAAIEYPSRPVEFLAFIKQNPLLWGSAHIPIILELMCGVWNERKNQGKVLNNQLSMTELYEELVLKLCKRYLQKRSHDPIKREEARKLRRQAVFEKCKPVLEFLGELAFETSKRAGNSIFIDNDLIQRLRDKYEVNNLSLIDDILESHFLKNTGNESDIADQSFYFVHLTFQEYFAAYHIVRKLKQNDLAIIRFIKENKYTASLEVTWWFVAGLLKDDQETLERFFDVLEEEPRDLIGLYHQMLLMRCMDECNLQVQARRKEKFLVDVRQSIVFSDCIIELGDLVVDNIGYYLPITPRLFNQEEIMRMFVRFLTGNRGHVKWLVLKVLDKQLILPLNIINLLLSLLVNKERSAHRRSIVANILGKQSMMPQRAFDDLVELLQDKDKEIRSAAASVLGKQSMLPQKILEGLVTLLKDEDEGVRAAAGSALGDSLPEEILGQLIKLLQDRKVYLQAASVLRQQATLPQTIVNSLLHLFITDKNVEIRGEIAYLLRQHSTLSQETLSRLVDLLQDLLNDPWGQSEVAHILCNQSPLPKKIVERLASLLQNEDKLAYCVIIALSKELALPQEVVNRLVSLWQDGTGGVRSVATDALSNQSVLPQEIINRFVSVLQNEEGGIKSDRAKVLSGQSASVLPIETLKCFVDLLQDPEPLIRYRASRALGNQSMLPQNIVDRLLSLLQDKENVEARHWAVRALDNQSGLPLEIINCLVKLSQDQNENESVRSFAVRILGDQVILSLEVMKCLISALQAKDSQIRFNARDALSKRSALPLEILNRLGSLLQDKDVKYSVVMILGCQSIQHVLMLINSEIKNKKTIAHVLFVTLVIKILADKISLYCDVTQNAIIVGNKERKISFHNAKYLQRGVNYLKQVFTGMFQESSIQTIEDLNDSGTSSTTSSLISALTISESSVVPNKENSSEDESNEHIENLQTSNHASQSVVEPLAEELNSADDSTVDKSRNYGFKCQIQ
jgi:HEAT repeat protein